MIDQSQLALDVPAKSTWEKRDYDGFVQYREAACESWHFYVCGFESGCGNQGGYCNVMRTDGDTERVFIDARDRLLINGRWYGRRQWKH